MIAYFKSNADLFPDLVAFSLNKTEKMAWRSALLIGHLMRKNDPRIQPKVNKYI